MLLGLHFFGAHIEAIMDRSHQQSHHARAKARAAIQEVDQPQDVDLCVVRWHVGRYLDAVLRRQMANDFWTLLVENIGQFGVAYIDLAKARFGIDIFHSPATMFPQAIDDQHFVSGL